MTENMTITEKFTLAGDNLVAKVKELIHEGNVRRVILKREDGTTLVEVPLQAGLGVTVLTAALAPALVAIGAIAAVVSQATSSLSATTTPPAASTDRWTTRRVGRRVVPRHRPGAPRSGRCPRWHRTHRPGQAPGTGPWPPSPPTRRRTAVAPHSR